MESQALEALATELGLHFAHKSSGFLVSTSEIVEDRRPSKGSSEVPKAGPKAFGGALAARRL